MKMQFNHQAMCAALQEVLTSTSWSITSGSPPNGIGTYAKVCISLLNAGDEYWSDAMEGISSIEELQRAVGRPCWSGTSNIGQCLVVVDKCQPVGETIDIEDLGIGYIDGSRGQLSVVFPLTTQLREAVSLIPSCEESRWVEAKYSGLQAALVLITLLGHLGGRCRRKYQAPR